MEKVSIDKQILERVLVDSTPLLDIYRARRMGTSKKELYNVIRR